MHHATRDELTQYRESGFFCRERMFSDDEVVEGGALPTVLPAGSVLWYHRDLVHGSQQYLSDSNRRIFVLAYQPAGLHRWRLNQQRPVRSAHA